MARALLFAACLLCFAGTAAAQTTVPIDVHSAFLHLDPADVANSAIAISLASLGLAPGYTIGLECAGDWNAGPGGDVQTNMLCIFSSNATLLGPTLLHRVPGAIDAGLHNYSGPTYPGGEPTDIVEDFLAARPGVTVVIPAGATHLFVTPADIYYTDNSDPDGDLGIKITLVSTASVRAGMPDLPRLTLSAHPNPSTAGSAIAFRLASAASVRLTIHDMAGRLVQTLVAGRLESGGHVVPWDGRDASGRRAPAGSYFARLENGVQAAAARIILLH